MRFQDDACGNFFRVGYGGYVTGATRHQLGQWFTPAPVVDLTLALSLEQNARRSRVLDPACGDGAFLHRLAQRKSRALMGIELDPQTARAARARVPGADIRTADFFATSLERNFDAVVGNPPYVRTERLPAAVKDSVQRCLVADHPDLPAEDLLRLSRRGDLAAAFILRALALVKPLGRVGFVVSGALLDAEYAQLLWRVVSRVARVRYLVEAPEERWFPDAAVNAMIVVCEPIPTRAEDAVTVARLTLPVAEAARRVRVGADLAAVAELRSAPAGASRTWASFVRSPRAWFDFKAAAGKRLVPLAELAEVCRGTTSGANEVFYLERTNARSLGIEPKVLWPLIRSPRDLSSGHIQVDAKRTRWQALMLPPDAAALSRHPRAAKYFAAHESAKRRPTLRARPLWWALPGKPARLFLTKSYAQRFVQPLTSTPVVADQRMYVVQPRALPEWLLAAVLNATWTAFALEALGRASLGEGAMEWTVADAQDLPVLDPRHLGAQQTERVQAAFARLSSRSIGPVFSEREQADRRALDLALAGGSLGRLVADVQDALCAQVARRNRRATTDANETS